MAWWLVVWLFAPDGQTRIPDSASQDIWLFTWLLPLVHPVAAVIGAVKYGSVGTWGWAAAAILWGVIALFVPIWKFADR